MSLISYLTRIHFAERVLDDALASEIARLGAKRPVLLFDEDGRSGDRLSIVEDALPRDCSPLRADEIGIGPVRADRPEAERFAASRVLHVAGGDLIVAFGGEPALRFARRLACGSASGLPLIAIPTTTADMGLPGSNSAGRRASPEGVMPAAVLCDPTLTYDVAPDRTAAHGFDALTHCIEAFLAPGYNPPADGIALEGIFRAAHNLEAAVANPLDPVARREVMAAALNGALAGQKGLGGIEALARAIEAESAAARPHGRLHASFLPHVLAFNAPAVGDRYARIATAIGARRGADPIAALADFGARLGLPDRIGALGLDHAALQRVAAGAAAQSATQTNPRHATKDDYLTLLRQAV